MGTATGPTLDGREILDAGNVPPRERLAAYERVVNGGFVRAVRALVRRGDCEALRTLARGESSVMELIGAEHHAPFGSAEVGPSIGVAGANDVERAARAVAALGAVMVDPSQAELRDQAVAWFRVAPVPTDPIAPDAPGVATEVRPVVEALRGAGEDPPQFAVALGAHLADVMTDPTDRVGLAVLFDAGTMGQSGVLTLATSRALGIGLIPDPRTMALFCGDGEFARCTQQAWSLSPADRTVVWRLEQDELTPEVVSGASLGAAMAVALGEAPRLDSRWRRLRSIRRLGLPSVAVTGDVAPTQRLVPVGGLRAKVSAAELSPSIRRVVVPCSDPSDPTSSISELRPKGVDLIAVGDVTAARREVQRIDPGALVRTALAIVAVLAVAAGAFAWREASARSAAATRAEDAAADAERARLTTVADRVAKEARDGAATSTDGEALLLAMVADDLFEQVGRPPSVLTEVQGKGRSPVRILRPERGRYTHAISAASGRYVLAWTDTGYASITDVIVGNVIWREDAGGSGGPTRFRAAASHPSSDLFALDTAEGIELLLPTGTSVWPMTDLVSGAAGEDAGAVPELAFDPAGKALLVYRPGAGVSEYRLNTGNLVSDRRCDADERFAPKAITVRDADRVLGVTADGAVTELDLRGCRLTAVRPGVDAFTATDLAYQDDGVEVVGSSRSALVVIGPDGVRSQLASDGPYDEIAFGRNGTRVSASSDAGPTVLDVASGDRVVSLGSSGTVVSSADGVLWVRDGVVEVFRDGVDFSASLVLQLEEATDAALGGDHMLLAGDDAVSIVQLVDDPATYVADLPSLDLPAGQVTAVDGLDVSEDGARGVAIAEYGEERVRRLRMWNLETGVAIDLPGPRSSDGSVNVAAFVDGRSDRLVVGYRSGEVDLLGKGRAAGAPWRRLSHLELDGFVMSIDDFPDGGGAAVLSGAGQDDLATISRVEIMSDRLRERTSRTFDRRSGDTGHAVALSTGDVIVVMADGTMHRYGSGLAEGATGALDLAGIRSVAKVPNRDLLLLAGADESALVSTRTLRTTAGPPEAGGFGTPTSARPSGDLLVTTHASSFTPRVTAWNLGREGSRTQACQAVERDLTLGQWRRLVGPAIPFKPPCRGLIRHAAYPWASVSREAKPIEPFLEPASGACPDGASLGGHMGLEIVRSGSQVVVCREGRGMARVRSTYDGRRLAIDSVQVFALPDKANDRQYSWALVVERTAPDGERTWLAGLQHGTETLYRQDLPGAVARMVSRVPKGGNAVELIGLVIPSTDQTIFLPRVEAVGDGSEGGATHREVMFGFTWPAAAGGAS